MLLQGSAETEGPSQATLGGWEFLIRAEVPGKSLEREKGPSGSLSFLAL